MPIWPTDPIAPQDRSKAKAGIFGRRSARWPLSLGSTALAISATAVILSAGQASAQGLTFSTSSLSVPEGGTATYGVKLTVAPNASVTLTIAPSGPSAETDVTVTSVASLTFTNVNWNTDQQVKLSAAEDDDSANGTEAIIHTASGANYGGVVATLTVTEADNDPLGFVFAQSDGTALSSLSVPESGTVIYQVKLASQPSASTAVTVQAFGGSTDDSDLSVVGPFVQGQVELAFLVTNWNIYQSVTLTAAPDADAAAGTARIRHRASGSGSDYNDVSTNLTATEIDDDEAALTLSVSALTVSEEGSAGYTVKLATRPTDSVTVAVARASGDSDLTVTSGASLTFTTGDWNTAQPVSISAGDDADYDDGTAEFTHTASGGDYGGVVSTLTVTEEDNDIRPDFVFDPASVKTSLTVPEGGTATYRVKLTAKPSGDTWVGIGRTGGDSDLVASPAELAFTTGNWNDWKTVTVTAKEDADKTSGTAVILHLGDEADYDGVQYRLAVTEEENDALVLTPSSLTVTEGGSASFGVELAAQPGGSVTVAVSRNIGSDSDLKIKTGENTTATTATLTFATDSWNTKQYVTLTAEADNDDFADGTAAFTLTASGSETATATLTATEDDTTERGYEFDPAALTVPENGSATYRVRLKSQPVSTVWLDIGRPATGGGDSDLATDPSATTLIFETGNWNAWQTVTVKATDDSDALNGTAVILHRGDEADYDGLEYRLIATEADDDATLVLSARSLTVTENGTASYGIRLGSVPGSDVTVTAYRSTDDGQDTDLGVQTGAILTFGTGNWNAFQTVTLTAADDGNPNMTNGTNDDVINGTALFVNEVTGGNYGPATATLTAVESDDDAELFLWPASSGKTKLSEIGVPESDTLTLRTALYYVSLSGEPAGRFTVTITKSGEPGEDADLQPNNTATSFVFDASQWNTRQPFTITADPDDDAVDGTAKFIHVASGGSFGPATVTLPVTEIDNDLLEFTTTSLTVNEEGSASYGIRLRAVPSGNVAVSVSRSDDTNLNVVGEEPLNFTNSDWNIYKSVILTASADVDFVDSTETIGHTATRNGYTGVEEDLDVTIADNDIPGFVFTTTTEMDAAPITELIVPEGVINTAGVKTYYVKLSGKPASAVTVSIAKLPFRQDINLSIESGLKLTFAVNDWNTPKSVTLTATHDWDSTDGTAKFTHTGITGSSSEFLNVVTTLTAMEADNDPTGIQYIVDTSPPVRSVTSLGVSEGGTRTYHVRPATRPSGTVTLTVSVVDGGDSDISLVGDTPVKLTYTPSNWQILPRQGTVSVRPAITVTVAEDDDLAAGTAFIRHVVSGADEYNGVTGTLELTEIENDEAGLAFSRSTLLVPEQGINSYGLKLAKQPSGDVEVAVERLKDTDESKQDADLGLYDSDSQTFTFSTSDWNSYQSVTLFAAEDDDSGDGTAAFDHKATGAEYDDVTATFTATEQDEDQRGFLFDAFNSLLSVTEGNTASYGVKLASKPSGETTVTVSADSTYDSDISVIGPNGSTQVTLTFTTSGAGDWNSYQSVTVTAAQDIDAAAGEGRINHVASTTDGSDYHENNVESVLLTKEIDDDAALTLSPSSLSVPEEGNASYGVKLAGRPGDSVTVIVTVERSTDGTQDEDLSLLGESNLLTFDTSNWNTLQSLTVTAEADDDEKNGVAEFIHRATGGFFNGVTATLTVTEEDNTVSVTPRVVREALSQTAIAALTHIEWALENRFDSLPEIGIEGRLAGGSMDGSAAQGNSAMLLDGLPVSAKGRLVRPEPESGGLSAEDVVSGTEFMIGRATDGGQFGVLWMQGSVSSFNSGGAAPVDGDAWSVTLGADYRFGRSLAGLALSRIRTEGKYQDGPHSGTFDVRATALYPYFWHRPTSGLSFWGAVGYGTGRFEARPAGKSPLTTDLKMLQAILGIEQSILSRADRSGFELSFKGSIKWHRMTTEAIPELEALTAQSTRTRIGIEASWNWEQEDGSVLTPTLALAARHDTGTEQGGFGLEGNLGLAWTSPDRRLQASLTARTLLAHQVDRRREWTLSATFAYDPFPDSDYGFSAKLSPTWSGEQTGTAASATESLSGIRQTRSSGSNGLEGELRFGFPQMGGMASGALSTRGVVDDENLRLGLAYSFALNSAEDYRFRLGFGVDAERKAGRFGMHGGEINWSLEW